MRHQNGARNITMALYYVNNGPTAVHPLAAAGFGSKTVHKFHGIIIIIIFGEFDDGYVFYTNY